MDGYSISSDDHKRTSSDDRDYPELASSFLVTDINAVMKITQLLSELFECFQISSSLMASLDYKSDTRRIERCKDEGFDAGEQAEVIFNKFIQLKDLFEATFTAGVESQLHMEFRYNDPNAVIDSLRHEKMLKEREELEAHKEADVTGSLGKSRTEPQVVANDIISKASLKLKSENICLSERICGLEAVLRRSINENELTCLLLQDSQSNTGKLKNKVSELQKEILTQKLDFEEKLQKRLKQCFEALEESKYLKIENKKLQAIVDSIMEENSLLLISNDELRKQKMALQDHCAILEAEVKETLELFSAILKEVENLEAGFCRMLKEISLKEKFMNEELHELGSKIKRHDTNLARDDSLLNQMYLEKTAEVDDLERKLVLLMKQMATTFDENGREASEAMLELSCLREDKTLLEAALQEAQGKLRLCESKIELIHKESERKVVGVQGELAISKQKQEILMDCHRKVLSSLENVKNGESKLKNTVRRLELALKAGENDRKNLVEEVLVLKMKLQSMGKLQDEVLALKKGFIELEHENKCLKASFELVFENYEKLKAKNVTYLEELTAKQAACALQSMMNNEVARLTRTNRQLKGEVKYLDVEKEECFKRVQVLEDPLR